MPGDQVTFGGWAKGHFPFGESWYNATNDKLQFTTYCDRHWGRQYTG